MSIHFSLTKVSEQGLAQRQLLATKQVNQMLTSLSKRLKLVKTASEE